MVLAPGAWQKTMQPLGKVSPDASHDDLFIERYARLLKWSLRFTDNNRELAEDLVHDAFIQFTFTHPDLQGIHDLDNYLYGMLRNLHLSQVRRATRSRLQPLSIVEYESVETGLRAIDPRDQIQVQEELRRACHYACARKETAKIASVLILRFFHGYYPSEIVQIMRSSHQAVRESLRIARTEAKLYIDNPKALGLIGFTEKAANVESFPATFARSTTDFLGELRRMIFQSRRGECTEGARLAELYLPTKTEAIDCHTLAHLVSCQICLDEVNRVLNLPLLSERYPTDTIGQDKRKKGGPGGGSTGGEGPGQVKSKYQRWKRDFFEHDPQELCVSVNGYLEGTQKISSALSELTLNIKGEEPVNFVEIFSEQNVRLLLLNINELPPNGSDEQTTRVELSVNRTLDLVLRFRSPWPTLHVTYYDPTYIEPGSLNLDQEDRETAATAIALPGADRAKPKLNYSTLLERSHSPLLKLWRSVADWHFWLRPATVTAVVTLCLLATLLVVYRKGLPPPISAGVLLEKAVLSEEAAAATTDQVLHRSINLEERSAGGEILARRRIEVWQSAEKGITARRLYDERGALIAGDWRRADGVQTLYHHGKRPELRTKADKRTSAPVTFVSVWLLDPTAKGFVSLIGGSQNAQALETANTYVVSYGNVNVNSPGLIRASLVLGRADLHAVEQALVIRQGNEVREYRFTETSFERRRSDSVAPAVFEPDAELVSLETRNPSGTTSGFVPPSAIASAPPMLATAALEVDVVEALNNANAFTGEPIEVSRSADGRITVAGLVETDQRKRDLLAALANFKNNPAVQVKIETVAEAQARTKPGAGKPGQTSVGEVQKFEVTEGQSPAYTELRKRFSEAEARWFADSVLSRIQSARSHARAMKQISQRFSQSDLQSLTPAERTRWLALIRSHAESFVRETESVRRDLQQFFPEAAGAVPGLSSPPGLRRGADASSAGWSADTDLQARIRELFDASGTIERGLNQSFALTAGANNASPVKSSAFWRQFADAVGIAKSLAAAR